MLQPLFVFFNIVDFNEVECSKYKNIQHLIRSKNYVLNFTAVRYSLHRCSEMLIMLKIMITFHMSPLFLCI